MTPIFAGITLLFVLTIFLVAKRSGGVLFAVGACLLTLVLLGAIYLALATVIVGSM